MKMKERHDKLKKVEPIQYGPGKYIWYNIARRDKVQRYKGWWIRLYKVLEDADNGLYNISTKISGLP